MNGNLAYQDDFGTELIGGKLVMMSPAAMNHVLISGNIYHIFASYLRGKSCIPIADGAYVFLTEEEHYVPDFMVVCDQSKIQSDGVHGAPDLLVEVLSPSTAGNDRGKKKQVYEACGVKEYWIVDPANKTVEQYLLREGRFFLDNTYALLPEWTLKRMRPEARAAIVTEFKCSLYDDLTITLEDVFDRVP